MELPLKLIVCELYCNWWTIQRSAPSELMIAGYLDSKHGLLCRMCNVHRVIHR